MGSHYNTLGISKNASLEEIKAAFRKLSKETHPDVAGSDADTDKFKTIANAHSVLANLRKRQVYDMELEEASRYGRPIDRSSSGFGGTDTGIRHPKHNASRGMQGVLETIYRPRNLFIVGPLVVLTAVTAANYFSKKDEHTFKNTTKMVEAWKNPTTGRWEQPAPWDPAYRQYRKINPQLELVPRDKVRTRDI